MCEDIFNAIERHENLFTRLEQTIARYVLTHGREVLNLSISELSFNCGVAVSTVFRFCQRLGFSGYREFLLRLAVTLEMRESAADASDGEEASIVNELYQSRMTILRETCRLLRKTSLEKTVERMTTADRILLVGAGASLSAVISAYQRLLSVHARVAFSLDGHAQRLLAATLSEKDVMLAFSYSGETPEVLAMVETAKRRGAHVIALTHFNISPLCALADEVFLSAGPSCALTGKAAFLDAHAFIIDVLCSLYSTRQQGRGLSNAQSGSPFAT